MRNRLLVLLVSLAVLLPATALAQIGASPGVAKDAPPLAVIRARAQAGDDAAQYELAQYYLWGLRGVRRDRRQSLVWLDKAAQQGHRAAIERRASEREDLATYERERAAALTGDPQAQYQFGADLSKLGCFGEDREGGFRWVMRAARKHNADAEAWMGRYYAYGYAYYSRYPQSEPGDYPSYAGSLGAENLPRAIAWYTRAGRQDQVEALNVLPALYGMQSPLQNPRRMEQWAIRQAYRPAQANDDYLPVPQALALGELCWYYDKGYFIRSTQLGYPISANFKAKPDPVKAFSCYRFGHLRQAYDAVYRLAELYEFGLGTPRDTATAEALYRQAIAQAEYYREDDGNEQRAAMRLGLLIYTRGDLAEAYQWLARTPDDKHCRAERYDTEDRLLLCHRAAAARDGIKARLPEAR